MCSRTHLDLIVTGRSQFIPPTPHHSLSVNEFLKLLMRSKEEVLLELMILRHWISLGSNKMLREVHKCFVDCFFPTNRNNIGTL